MTIALLLLACSVDWAAHDAWRHCKPAIAKWPARAAPPCGALHMCANEAPLTMEERAKLTEMITAGACGAP
ncbi:MAG: hypothetical protein Q8P18_16545 [Pseudomonadota bacterium]|nr:hypothetical protein [Pseudomonadota bacterium]